MYEVEVKVEADLGPVQARLAELDATHLGVVTQVDTYFDAPHRDFAESDEALRLRREVGQAKGGTEVEEGNGREAEQESGEESGVRDGEETGEGSGEETGEGNGEETGEGSGEETGEGNGEETGEGNGEETGEGNGVENGSTTTTITYKGPLVDEESKTRREAETTVGDAGDMQAVLRGLGFEPAATVRKERQRFAYEGYTVCLDEVRDLGQFVEVERKAEAVERVRDGARSVLEDLGLDPADGIRTSYLGLLIEVDEETAVPFDGELDEEAGGAGDE